MSGEFIQSDTFEDYWSKLKAIYNGRALEWKDLTKEKYEAIERSEREDSDNHINEDRLGKDTQVIDLCWYKFMPDREAAYHIQLHKTDHSVEDHYFKIKLRESSE